MGYRVRPHIQVVEAEGYGIMNALLGFAAIGGFIWVYQYVTSSFPQFAVYANWVGGFLLFIAAVFTVSTVGRNRVKWWRWATTWSRSWGAFALGLAIMAGFWFGCYWLVATYAAKYLHYFRWGIIVAGAFSVLMLIFNEPLVVLITKAKWIRKREDCPELWDAVSKVTPWHARPRPRTYLLPDYGMNAISFGWGIPFFSAVGATRGLIEELDQNEIEAVMAHEVGHIINKDILISMIMGFTVMVMAATGWILLRLGPYGSESSRSSDKNRNGAAILVLLLVGGVMYVFGRILGVILQAFISREREYAADATSARIMGSSEPLQTALQKIVANPRISSEAFVAAAGFLCTADPEPMDVMATHPPISKRLEALAILEK